MINEVFLREPWLKWAIELQSIAQCGLTYAKDVYDIERYEQLRDIAAEMMSYKTDIPVDKVKTLFCNEEGYQTPKLDTRAAIFRENKILLVHEKNGTWSMPGGWVDVLETIESNTVKEVREESGLNVKAERVIAIQDRNRHNAPPYAYGICKVFLLCSVIDGSFTENTETTGFDYFALDHLPLLAEEKCNEEQIRMCFQAYQDENWKVLFD
ncbi:MAG: NUDIX hydrolase [Lachnospiraceae bacterium]|nr:NUDIX hydrolase [Lachnospiraceae bacterium]